MENVNSAINGAMAASLEPQFDNNALGTQFDNNALGAQFDNNALGTQFVNNALGAQFDNNALGTQFVNNAQGAQFVNNAQGAQFDNNALGVMIANLTPSERKELMQRLMQQEEYDKTHQRASYESLRESFMAGIKDKVLPFKALVMDLKKWIEGECTTFKKVMNEYAQLKNDTQENYTIISGDFKVVVACNKVKGFDERADLAAERLIEYLKRYVKATPAGEDDAMYQMAMTLLERNKMGDLDYKSISKLYELESRFDEEYKDIMQLFKESNVIHKTATNYYFYQKNELGVWQRIELSFCRL